MEIFVGKVITVPFESLFLDPNNPRLGQVEGGPGYENLEQLFDANLQEKLQREFVDIYKAEELTSTIIGQGWMPIDNIVVWTHPDRPDSHIVVEGNRRTLALRRIRSQIIDRERLKLQRMEKSGERGHARHDITDQRDRVSRLEQIIAETKQLSVVPLAAKSVDELRHKLPRVLAVRHITHAQSWGNFAEDLWLLQRYQQLFDEKYPKNRSIHWETDLTKRVAEEASLTEADAKRKLRAASAFSHFKAEFEDRLENGEEFKSQDYFLFENIVKKSYPCERLGLGESQLNLPRASEELLFEWAFKLPRGKTADENANIFYRHENIALWDQMKRYDDKNNTSFASRLDVDNYKETPTMREIEAEFMAHKARKKPQAVIEELLRRLQEISRGNAPQRRRVSAISTRATPPSAPPVPPHD